MQRKQNKTQVKQMFKTTQINGNHKNIITNLLDNYAQCHHHV